MILAIPIYVLMGWATRNTFARHNESFTILSPLFQASETLGLGLNHAAIIATMLLVSLLLSSLIMRLAWPARTSRAGGRRRFR